MLDCKPIVNFVVSLTSVFFYKILGLLQQGRAFFFLGVETFCCGSLRPRPKLPLSNGQMGSKPEDSDINSWYNCGN